jgi:MFS family permease
VTRERWITLLVVSAATAMLLLDVTVVNVALPAIRADLDASFGEMQWVIDAYALTLAATLLSAGALADRIGRRRVFIWGLAIFTACSALCAAASSPVFLDLARAAQGSAALRCSRPRLRSSVTSSKIGSAVLPWAFGAA